MTGLLLIRHAETDLAGSFCGQCDPPVNAAGLQQIQRLLPLLRKYPPHAVFTSDLRRAVDTAHPIAAVFNVQCFARPALREIGFGRWEGLRWNEVEALHPAYASAWLQAFPHLPAPDGERFEDFETRVLVEADHLLSRVPFQSAAVVTHAGVMRTILRRISGVDDVQAWQLTKPYCAALRIKPNVCEVVA